MTQDELAKLLKRPVTPRMVEIWNGNGIPADKAEAFRQLWLKQAGLAKEVRPAESFLRKPCKCGRNPNAS